MLGMMFPLVVELPDVAGKYRGSIGPYPVAMLLKQRGDTLVGAYRYMRRKEDLVLDGRVANDGTVTLRELGRHRTPSGTFRGQYRKGRIEGTFTRLSDRRTFSFRLSKTQ